MLDLLKTVNFRHTYAVLTLVTFVILTTLPFWIGSKNLTQQAWSYLQNAQSAMVVLLTLAGRRYFDNKEKKETDDNFNTISTISNKQCSCGQNPTPLS